MRMLAIASMREIWVWVGVVTLCYYAIWKRRRGGGGAPPGPKSLPIIGHLHLLYFSSVPHRVLGRLAAQFGPLFSLRLGCVNHVVVSSPAMAKEFLKTHDASFSARPKFEAGRILSYNWSELGVSDYGPRSKHIRKIFVDHLFSPKRIRQTQHIRSEETFCTLQSILDHSLAHSPVNLTSKLSNLTTNIITRIAFGKKFFGKGSALGADTFEEMIREAFILSGVFNLGDYLPFLSRFDLQGYRRRMEDLHQNLDAFFQRIVDDEVKNLAEGRRDGWDNLVRVLLQAESEEEGSKLDLEAVKSHTQDIMFAATDTNSTTVGWAMAELLQAPSLIQRIKQEVDDVVGSERLVDEDDIPNLPFLQAVVKETFRLHPAAPLLFTHTSTQDCNVGGYHIPKGTHLLVNAWQIGRDPKVWKDPHVFDPDRFINSNIDPKGNHFELIPFGSGRRMCPGMPLALPIVHIILARLLHTFDWEVIGKIDFTETFGFTMPREKPLLAFATPRLNLALS